MVRMLYCIHIRTNDLMCFVLSVQDNVEQFLVCGTAGLLATFFLKFLHYIVWLWDVLAVWY